MMLPDYVTVERRKVKHARLRVSASGDVLLIVPHRLGQGDIEGLYGGKAKWVEEKRQLFLSRAPKPVDDAYNQRAILLHGEQYCLFNDGALKYRTRIDHVKKVVVSGRELNDPAERERWFRRYARRYFLGRVKELAQSHGFTFNRLFVRSQLTKWGNHSSLHNISLNWRLIKSPAFVSDYVILHELLHTIIPNHSAAFWTRLGTICPDFRRAVEFLSSTRV